VSFTLRPFFGQKNFAVPFRKRMHNSSSTTTTATTITKTIWGPQTYQKSKEPLQYSKRQKRDDKQVLCLGATNIRCHNTNLTYHGDLVFGICASLVMMMMMMIMMTKVLI